MLPFCVSVLQIVVLSTHECTRQTRHPPPLPSFPSVGDHRNGEELDEKLRSRDRILSVFMLLPVGEELRERPFGGLYYMLRSITSHTQDSAPT